MICNIFKNNSAKIFLIFSLMLFSLVLVMVVITPPASGYELSIYAAYPSFFWISLLLSIFLAQLSLLSSFFTEKNKYWLFAYLVILLNSVILLFLPIIRDYYVVGTGDVLTHIGFINNLLNSGSVGDNMYPLNHILASSIFLLSGIEVKTIINFISPLLSIFYLLSLALIAKSFLKKEVFYLSLIFTSILLFGTTHLEFSPYIEGILLFPFTLFLYFKSQKSEKMIHFTILLIIFLVTMTFLHPLIAQILIIIFVIMTLIFYKKNKFFIGFNADLRSGLNLILIILLIFFTWNAYVFVFLRSISKVFNWLIGESVTTQFSTYSNTISYSDPSLLNILQVIFNRYGQYVIITLIVLFCLVNLLKYLKNNNRLNNDYLFTLFAPAAMFSIFIIFSFIAFLGVSIFTYDRFIPIAMIFAVILIPTCLYKCLKISKTGNSKLSLKVFNNRNLKLILITMSLFFIVYFSIFNFYFSPIIKQSNEQLSKGEYVGLQTFFETRDDSLRLTELGISTYRVYESIYGAKKGKRNIDIVNNPPDHFNYNNSTSFANSFNKSTYFILAPLGEKLYPSLYPEFKQKWRFYPEDFEKLKENDNGVQEIYNNGDINIFLVG